MATDRKAAERRGHNSESLAALWLRLKGYRILARHWKCSSGEIDIVARRGRILAFIEVKARDSAANAAESLSRKQQARIARAASQFVAGRTALQQLDQRFDIMLVVPWRLPLHASLGICLWRFLRPNCAREAAHRQQARGQRQIGYCTKRFHGSLSSNAPLLQRLGSANITRALRKCRTKDAVGGNQAR